MHVWDYKNILTNFRLRKRLLAIADAFIIVVAGFFVNLPLPLFADRIGRPELFSYALLTVFSCFACLLFFGAYNKLWRYFSKRDYLSCVKGVVAGFAIAGVIHYLMMGDTLWEFSLATCIVSIIGICLFRYLFRGTFISLVETGHREAFLKRTMIIGAGNATAVMLKEIERSRAGHGENRGSDTVINRIEQIIFAIPSCPPKDRQVILDLCGKTGLPVKVLPFIGTLVDTSEVGDGSTNFVSQIRDIKVEDLLGRPPIKFDNRDIREFIEGKVCMVTGGGGSIGSELVRQIAKYGPKQVIIVDIYENNAYEIQQELVMEYGGKLNLVTLIASVRDYFRMNQIFKKYKPEVVFHAAAHKHVPLMETNPMEAIKNNVIGTFNMATLALYNNVGKFVMISTDKAVNPTNVMGASKRCCEMIVQFFAQQKDCRTEFVTTRFGNVLGSNGSVIPLFKRQIEQGKPVTVTHPDIIRYFMTIPEAVNLVLEAASIAHGGEIFVLDMGQPVKIVSLAENLIRMYGKVPYKDVEIKFTGLRPGEKIKEELLMNEEGLQKTRNKLIFIGKQIEIDSDKFISELWKLKTAASANEDDKAIKALHEIGRIQQDRDDARC